MMRFKANSRALRKVGITASLDKPEFRRARSGDVEYVREVVTSSSNGAPLGNGLLQSSW